MKYINKDRLRTEITKYESTAENAYNPSNEDADYWHGKVVACEDILDIIVSLQQEQPEDLEKEIDAFWNPRFNFGWDEYSALSMNHSGFASIARHFAEWQKAKMMKDAVEGLICATITGTNAISFLSPLPKELTAGDKVRIIVLKKEESK